MAIVGHSRIRHLALPERSRRSLQRLIETAPDEWRLLFVRDSRDRRWTLNSADLQYTAMFAPAAHTLELTFDIFSTEFPCWKSGWQIS
ncbi:hypothetical protein ACQP2F_14115 [Actinoplanes sp. CA-030573]|uniref:hypothetical protein n=1 Tax=Actinoplanes sp. CA-030573 TaxID=3239898 RepID=UPI003D913D3B